jgi:hypothetical protein
MARLLNYLKMMRGERGLIPPYLPPFTSIFCNFPVFEILQIEIRLEHAHRGVMQSSKGGRPASHYQKSSWTDQPWQKLKKIFNWFLTTHSFTFARIRCVATFVFLLSCFVSVLALIKQTNVIYTETQRNGKWQLDLVINFGHNIG